ncbi:MAG: RnfABCDGE type electron transport complex subunit B [Spirochaetia bacterium]|jgi:electron transport complex protein RnfB|nr:RnfABCDGE type electron transport complex subunit B [Spirochaetia bacterium]
MVFIKILYAFISVTLMGGILGIGLAIAARILAVKKDERVANVEAILPGVNCGACGFPGCAGYADGIVNEDADITLCSPGGPEVLAKITELMGKEAGSVGEKMVAQVHCRGNRDTSTYTYNYEGLNDCNAMQAMYKGDKDCKYGCLAGGSCIKVCPADAISRDDKNRIWVNRELCISCEKCVIVCPTGVMQMIPYNSDVIVACNSLDKGGKVKKYCSVGCIGCKICEKKSPDGGFVVENFLATINYNLKGDRIDGLKGCPSKCIISAENASLEIESVGDKQKVNE